MNTQTALGFEAWRWAIVVGLLLFAFVTACELVRDVAKGWLSFRGGDNGRS